MMQRAARSLVSKLPKSPKPSKFPQIPSKIPQNPSRSRLSPFTTEISPSRTHHRSLSTNSDHSSEIDEINMKFAEAREEIEAAMESKETVYFDEEAECARDAVKIVLDKFEGLMARMEEKERMALQRSMGLKIEQLKAELKQLDE
ncbi:uncharacterized protein A4U43_C06F8050 [Asparagus officinalis]|uniref:Uncharacterized protein n=1 Tax=Asparagus officinalis TaxID=4686 RepID=A0A5P1ENR0_ASPOF|nr:uncharacterized protein LOC109844793 [Asparagus officinalis]XP_020269529.1 uncharacterized protein LOC109844796 [Asparagus officinalis]ONK66439.1 uncharacterized protein A4U43_C06F8050 [Asparagus officinalis]